MLDNLLVPSELWSEIKRYISPVDREEAADAVVNILIDHDFDAEQIRDAFKGDSDIKAALGHHVDEEEEDLDEDLDPDDADNGEWD